MNVTFRFEGICTYFNDFSRWTGQAETVNRMVVVNGKIDRIGDHDIVPHLARMRVVGLQNWDGPLIPNRLSLYDLNGSRAYHIRVANPLPLQRWTNNAQCLPHLQASMPDGRAIGLPNMAVVKDGDAACYVDFTHGRIDGYAVKASTLDPKKMKAISIVTVETDGEPRLEIETPEGRGTMLLKDGAIITISNAPLDRLDEENDGKDFSLNFLTVTDPPLDPVVPQSISCPPYQNEKIHGDAGPGCSNTNYP
ncbi:MAG: hypothetical protein JOZ54_13085 [Acidobacteria bacterium]|nr:hypothetical protein [Acidobacteriota bacterium]